MQLWRATVISDLRDQEEGFAIVWADTSDEAKALVARFLEGQTAYGKPFKISEVQPSETADTAHVVFMNWGEWPDYPPDVEHS